MIVRLNHEEIIEACVQWVENTHGITVRSDARVYAVVEKLTHVTDKIAIDLPDARESAGPAGPYR